MTLIADQTVELFAKTYEGVSFCQLGVFNKAHAIAYAESFFKFTKAVPVHYVEWDDLHENIDIVKQIGVAHGICINPNGSHAICDVTLYDKEFSDRYDAGDMSFRFRGYGKDKFFSNDLSESKVMLYDIQIDSINLIIKEEAV